MPKYSGMDINDAWLAGLFEGEGCIYRGTSRKGAKSYELWRLQIISTDYDVLLRAHEIAGVGQIYGPHTDPKHPGRKPYWRWACNRRADINELLTRLRPLLGERRGEKADEFFTHWASYEPQGHKPGHCRRDHEMVDPIFKSGRPTCRTCENMLRRERRRAAKTI